jgi:AcrR family transcriptional regulator
VTEARKRRVSAAYWVELGLRDLARRGPDAVTIDALCREAGKTKGSFYAHFESHDAFLSALAEAWRQRDTEAVMRAADAAPTASDRLAALDRLAIRLDPKLDRAMRQLSDRHAGIADAVGAVDETRIAYLARLHVAAKHGSEEEARDIATIEYAAFAGLDIVRPGQDLATLERLHATFERLLSRRRTGR